MLGTHVLGAVVGASAFGIGTAALPGSGVELGLAAYALVLIGSLFTRVGRIDRELLSIRAALGGLLRRLPPLLAVLAVLGAGGCRSTYETTKSLTIHSRALTVSWPAGEKSTEPEPGGVWIFIDMTDNPAAKAEVESAAEIVVTPKAIP